MNNWLRKNTREGWLRDISPPRLYDASDEEHGRELWRVRAETVLKFYAEVFPIWDDQLKWPVAEGVRDLVFAVYFVANGQKPRFVARKAVSLPAEPERLVFPVLEIDQSRNEIPDAFALLAGIGNLLLKEQSPRVSS